MATKGSTTTQLGSLWSISEAESKRRWIVGKGKSIGSSDGFRFLEYQSNENESLWIQSEVRIPSSGQEIGGAGEDCEGVSCGSMILS